MLVALLAGINPINVPNTTNIITAMKTTNIGTDALIKIESGPLPKAESIAIKIQPPVMIPKIPAIIVKDEPIFSSSESESEAVTSPPPPPKVADSFDTSDEESLPPPPPPTTSTDGTRSLKRVDTADSSDDSSEEGPIEAKSDSDDTDSSDHVPPEDLQVKQLKKLDTLKESSA